MTLQYPTHKWAEVSCNLCGSRESRLLFVDQLTRNGENLQFRLVECSECGLWYVNPRNLTEAGRFYREVVAASQLERWVEEQGEHKQLVLKKLLDFADGYLGSKRVKDRRLLDVGCGVGWFLDYARGRGYQVYGAELATPEAEFARNRFGVEVFDGPLEASPFPDGYFQVITLNDVLEHLPDPLGTLRVVYRKLQPRGLLILRSANGQFALLKARVYAKLFPRRQYLLHPNEHLFQFTAQTMRRVLSEAGFRVLSIENGKPEFVPNPARRLVRGAWYLLSFTAYAFTQAYLSTSLDVFARKRE